MTAERPPASSAALIILATLATICALYFGREFFVPIALSVLFTGLLRPLVRWLEAAPIPTAAGATAVLVVFLGVVVLGANALADPVRGWISKAPQSLNEAEAVPYLGAAFMLIALAVAGLGASQSVGQALLAPGAYLLISTPQNNLVSPVAYERRLRLNPVAVLVGVLFWWFLWGVPGAFLSVPIIAAVKIMGDHIEGLEAVGEFLAE